MRTLNKLKPPTLAPQHADAVVGRLEDSDEAVRALAPLALSHLLWATLVQHADAVVARRQDSAHKVRAAALIALSMIEPAARIRTNSTFVVRSSSSDSGLRLAKAATPVQRCTPK